MWNRLSGIGRRGPGRGGWGRRAGLALILNSLVLGGSPAFAAARTESDRDWFRLGTPNFELYSNGSQGQARRLLRELETFRHVVSRFLGLTNVQTHPALVFLFKDEASFEPYKPRYDGQPSAVGGFHAEDPLDYSLALCRQGDTEATMRVLFHEYTHLLTAREFRHAPVWLHEGVAEAFSSFEGHGDRFDIGRALERHVTHLLAASPMPATQLLQVTRDSPDYNEKSRAGRFYATSWLLAHHLLFARRGFETNIIGRYAAMCASTTNQLDAFFHAFGSSPPQYDLLLTNYVRGGEYTLVRQTFPDLESVRPRELKPGPGDIAYALGRLLQLTDQEEAARARFRQSSEEAPDDPRPYEALTVLAWRGRDREGVLRNSEAALSRGSREAFVHYLAAEARYQGLILKPPADRSAALAEGRRLCESAIQIEPGLAAAHHLLGVYVLAQNPRAPALAAVHVEEALRCDPLYPPALLTWASLLATQGKIQPAREVLMRLMAGPLAPDLREIARLVSEDVERYARAASAQLPPPR